MDFETIKNVHNAFKTLLSEYLPSFPGKFEISFIQVDDKFMKCKNGEMGVRIKNLGDDFFCTEQP